MRMNFVRLGWSSLLASLCAISAGAQPLPQLRGASARTQVASSPDSSGIYVYDYALAAGSDSDGGAFVFELDLARPPGTAELDDSGLTLELGVSTRSFATWAADFGLNRSTFTPVGCEAPNGWGCGTSVRNTVDFANREPGTEVLPGGTLGGFVIRSRGLPRVVPATLEPSYTYVVPNDGWASDEDEALARQAYQDIKFPVSVVAPVPPPEPFVAAAFVSIIDGYRVAARERSWISSDALSNQLGALLAQTRTALEENRLVDAKLGVRDFLSLVAANSCTSIGCTGKPLTSEAFALMNVNMAFLRSKLPNSPPTCSGATASPNMFWPPNHELVEVAVSGASDPDGDPLELVVTAVTQDEGVDEPGSGNFCPDAVLDGDGTAQLRSERAGRLNGRVYRLSFSATDTVGADCTGVAKVCMPHEESQTPTCVEEPVEHDSTVCP